jgi:hypothetical protein
MHAEYNRSALQSLLSAVTGKFVCAEIIIVYLALTCNPAYFKTNLEAQVIKY